MATSLNTYSNKSEKNKHFFAFIICLVVPFIISALSGFITSVGMNGRWFISLEKPAFHPPNNVFGPVWTILYLLMGISIYQVWKGLNTTLRKKVLFIYALHLFLSFLWSILFFSFNFLFVSIFDLIAIWILVFYMIILYRRNRPSTGYLYIPYLLWVSFATILNIAFWVLNN